MTSSNNKLTITTANAGQRIDNFLVAVLDDVPRSRVCRAIRKGECRVNGGRVAVHYHLRQDDQLRIPPMWRLKTATSEKPPAVLLQKLSMCTLYEDDDLVVLNKPAGVPVHAGSGLVWGVIEVMRYLRPDLPQLRLIHRLDRATSGCLMMAKHRESLTMWHAQIRDRVIDKTYQLLVCGDWPLDREEVNLPLRKNMLQSGERMVVVDVEAGKPAKTHFTVLRRLPGATLMSARLMTGRTHQLRVHAAAVGCPIVGDPKYGDQQQNQHFRRLGLKRMFLHCQEMSSLEGLPDTMASRFEAALSDDWTKCIDALMSS